MTSRTLKLTLAAVLGITGIAHAEEPPNPRTLVEVNGEAVLDTQFLVYRAQRGASGQQAGPDAQVGLLNELVNTVMIAQAAEEAGLEKHPEVAAALDVSRYRILAEAAISQYLSDNPVTDEELETAYQARYGNHKLTEYKARHILLETEDQAKAVITELDKGGDFVALAKTKSTGPSGPNGGDLGWFEGGQMVAPFAEAVAGMEKGSHSSTPVQTQFGWHVILLEDTREQQPPTLADVRDQFTEQLQRQRVATYVKSIRDKAKVQVIQQQGAPAAQ